MKVKVSLEMTEGRMRGKEHSDYISSELDLQKGGLKKCWLLRAGFLGWADDWF